MVRAPAAPAGLLAAGGVGVVEVGGELAGLDQGGLAAGGALGVEGGGVEAGGVGGVVGDGERRRGDGLAQAARERGAAALHRVGAQGAADEADEAGRDGRVEDHGAGSRAGLSGAEQRGGALRGLAADLVGVEALGRAAHAEAEAGLLVAAVLGDRLKVGVGGGRLEGAGEPGRGGDRDPLLLVGVDRRLDPDHALVGLRAPPARFPWRARPCAPCSTRRGPGREGPESRAARRRRRRTAAPRTRRRRRSAPSPPRPGRSRPSPSSLSSVPYA